MNDCLDTLIRRRFQFPATTSCEPPRWLSDRMRDACDAQAADMAPRGGTLEAVELTNAFGDVAASLLCFLREECMSAVAVASGEAARFSPADTILVVGGGWTSGRESDAVTPLLGFESRVSPLSSVSCILAMQAEFPVVVVRRPVVESDRRLLSRGALPAGQRADQACGAEPPRRHFARCGCRTVLVALDGSPLSALLLRWCARHLLEPTDCVLLLCSLQSAPPGLQKDESSETARQEEEIRRCQAQLGSSHNVSTIYLDPYKATLPSHSRAAPRAPKAAGDPRRVEPPPLCVPPGGTRHRTCGTR